jgi:2',3'-cyclic-nucleotide 2'-phosphodiesterase (5'-nucleotidase family)
MTLEPILGERGFSRILIGLCVALSATSALAGDSCPLRIIHTNDLHSHLNHSDDPTRGGYAAVKAQIDALKAISEAEGIPAITLDAGDFTEGSEYFFADQGLNVFREMDHMGYDAVTIGNHDWVMGLDHLSSLLQDVRPGFQFLGANFIFDPRETGLKRWMKPYVELKRGGARIAILGLTTSEIFYKWRVDAGFIRDPISEAERVLPELRERNDFVIALTHLGVGEDQKLIHKVNGIDLVVGGHSHTKLFEPVLEENPDGQVIPIVQTGAHGEYVGELIVDACPGAPLSVKSYRLIPVAIDGPKDARIAAESDDALQELYNEYGQAWWNQVVGHSDVQLDPTWTDKGAPMATHSTEWGNTIADGLRASVHSDAAFDVGLFGGEPQPAGDITRGTIVAAYPHVFETTHKFGYTVWTTKVRGWVLRQILAELGRLDMPFSVSGMKLRTTAKGKLGPIAMGSRKLYALKEYRVAVPEALVRGAAAVSVIFKIFLHDRTDSKIPIWTAIEQQLRAAGPIHAGGLDRIQ